MEDLLKRLRDLNVLLKAFVPSIKPKQQSPMPSIQLPSASLKNPSMPKVPSLPGISPQSTKDPKKMAEQLKNPQKRKATLDSIKFNAGGQWSLGKAEYDFKQPPHVDFNLPHVDASNPNLVNANYHGMRGQINRSPEQRQLIHGLDLSSGEKVSRGKENLGVYNTAGSKWMKNPLNEQRMIVKPHTGVGKGNKEVQGLLGLDNPEGYNSARREVMFHNMANDFFDMGHTVPLTAGFTKNGVDYSAQQKLNNAHSLARHDYKRQQLPKDIEEKYKKSLKHLGSNGELHKMGLMDAIMGNNDRHMANYMVDNSGNKIHLIDNGLASDYSDLRAQKLPSYVEHAHDLGIEKTHPEAKKWLMNLSPEKAIKLWTSYGYSPDSPQVANFMERLKNAQEAFKHSGKSYRDTLMDVLKAKGPVSRLNYERTE